MLTRNVTSGIDHRRDHDIDGFLFGDIERNGASPLAWTL